jgi:5'-3' exonuclease
MNITKIILIDTSYTLFHRYFATLCWLKMAHTDLYKEHINDKDYDWIENQIFKEKYEKIYFEGITKLLGKKVIDDNTAFIFCMDTPKDQVWRIELNPNYKGERIDLSKKTNLRPAFNYTYNHIIPNLLNNPNFSKIRIIKLEADDIIATISRYLETKPEIKVYIISGDEDFIQLGRPNLSLINFKDKKIKEISIEDAKINLHNKILLGDKSDNIKSIFPPKFSLKIKRKLINSIDEFNLYISENKDIEKRYIENRNLIDFNYIPEHYKIQIINEFNNLIKLN